MPLKQPIKAPIQVFFSGFFYRLLTIMPLAFLSLPVHSPFNCPVTALEIFFPQMAIKLRTFHKLCICSRCNIFSFVKYYDLICLFYRRHLMCYHNNGLALTELCQRFVDKLFILCIRIRSCLIKNKYMSIFKEQSTDCNSLLFSSRKVVPTITNHCLILLKLTLE